MVIVDIVGLFLMVFQSMFFFLAQTEQGDIFKITLETDEDMVSMINNTDNNSLTVLYAGRPG